MIRSRLFDCKRLEVALLGLASLTAVAQPNVAAGQSPDPIAAMQADAVKQKKADWGHWGPNPKKYSSWTSHSNRLIPVYTFGGDLAKFTGANSLYRDAAAVEKLFGYLPKDTVNPQADYCDQTDVYGLQKMAAESGKKRIILFVFDGMDWHTTRAAAIANAGAVKYQEGRGEGLGFLDYRGVKTDFGYFVTSPHNEGTNIDVNDQRVTNPGGKLRGGYSAELCGPAPWGPITDAKYPIGTSEALKHAYTDSASSATSLTCGVKTYNDAINVDDKGREAIPIARTLQEQGFAVGIVTSVPISHATPACAYANNVHRDDYQDLTRDLIGRPSVYHPGGLAGVDVLIGAGFGGAKEKDGPQGKNFVPGNRYITNEDLAAIDIANGGKYRVAQRTSGKNGVDLLHAAAQQAASNKERLFGYFGSSYDHLPFRTANGDFAPVASIGNDEPAKAEVYSKKDLNENVTLTDMAMAAVEVLNARSDKWWLMVEAGDVDWANHANNIDNSIGAVLSGDVAFQAVTKWIENHGGWDDTLLVLTADHGHYLVLDQPEALIPNVPVVQ